MKAEQQPWTIHLHAKAKNFDFKFKATKFLPTCNNFFRFSLLLKLSPLLIQVKSDNHHTKKRKSLKSKVVGVFEKFRSSPTKRKAVAVRKSSKIKRLRWGSCKGSVCASTVVIGNLALLIQSISENDKKGIIIHSLSILFSLLTQLKTFIGTKLNNVLLVLSFMMVGYPVWLHMKNHLTYDQKAFASRYIGKAWNWAASTCMQLHRRRRASMESAASNAQAATAAGLEKQTLRKIPVAVFRSGANVPATECSICLGDFVDGEKVRVLPECNHEFHVNCVDKWLFEHTSCPICRHSLAPPLGRERATVSRGQQGSVAMVFIF